MGAGEKYACLFPKGPEENIHVSELPKGPEENIHVSGIPKGPEGIDLF